MVLRVPLQMKKRSSLPGHISLAAARTFRWRWSLMNGNPYHAILSLVLLLALLPVEGVGANEYKLPMEIFKPFTRSKILLVEEQMTGGCVYSTKIVTSGVPLAHDGLWKVLEKVKTGFKREGWNIEEQEDERYSFHIRFVKGSRACLVIYHTIISDSGSSDHDKGMLEIYIK